MDRDRQGLAGVIRRHPITAFFVWFFIVGQAFAFAPLYLDVAVAPQWFINGSTVFGLLLPAVVITWLVDGPEGLRALRDRVMKVRISPAMYAVGIVVVPLVATAIAVAVLGRPGAPAATLVTAVGSAFVVNAVVGFALNNLWEEVAWMGFVQARLQERHGALLAAAFTGPLFALQHIALFIGNGPVMAAVLLALAIALLVPYRALVAWLYNRTGGSLFLVGLVHAVGNAVTVGAGFRPGYLQVLYPQGGLLVGTLHLVTFAVMALVVIAATRGRLGLSRRAPRAARRKPSLATASVR